ncbi:MAG: DUF1937 family protein [Chlamydiales bacterium]|nr:DUF1937 family protein [Chlamydiales bacterium]NCF71777.1 DUF1937 family protein [Chlamydiales bacterium]
MAERRKLYYLGTPYNDPDPEVKRKRLAVANYLSLELLSKGKLVFSPLSHNLTIDFNRKFNSWEAWETLDLEILRRCDALIVLKQKGWENSVGLKAEIAFAKEHGIAIEEMEAPSDEQAEQILAEFHLQTVP